MTRRAKSRDNKTVAHHGNAIVAVVGRPNVGKSTLFNRLVGRREAIVHDLPGVTRDRHYATAWSAGHSYTIVDTGGFDPESDDPMRQGIARQVKIAIEEADIVVCVLDATAEPTDADRVAVDMLRKGGRPVIFVANKADSERHAITASELYSLGIDELITVSALHGRSFSDLEDAIVALLPAADVPSPDDDEEGEDAPDDGVVRVAVIGRPNAGKSSLINRLVQEERVLVDDRPGTTRDPVDVEFERNGRKFVFVDTAGIRRKSKVVKEGDTLDVVSVLRAMRAMEDCDVVVLMCDASEGVAEQDAKILGLACERGRAAIIALNKMDLVESSAFKKIETDAHDRLTFAPWAPVTFLSAKSGKGVGALLDKIVEARDSFRTRIGTGELNRFFESVLATHPPPTSGGRAPRLYYITQAHTAPPLFIIMASSPQAVHFSYQRYVTNQIRKQFGFEGSPVKVAYRERRRSPRKFVSPNEHH